MKKIKESFFNVTEKYPRGILFFLLIAFLLSLIPIRSIDQMFSSRIWFAKDSAPITQLNDFENKFGGDDIITIGIYHPDGFLRADHLEQLEWLTEQLWMASYVARVESIANANVIEVDGDDLFVNSLVESAELTSKSQSEVEESILKKLKESPEYYNYLIAENHNYVLIHLMLSSEVSNPEKQDKAISDIQDIRNQLQQKWEPDNPQWKWHMLGNVSATAAFSNIASSDIQKVIPLMFLIIIVLLIYFFRSLAGVIVPLTVTAVTIGSTFGMMGLLSFTYNNILSAIPGVLMAICMADTIHLLNTFYQQMKMGKGREKSLRICMEKNFIPTVLTTITTCFSFFTISFTELVPINALGILCGLGAIVAWIYTYTLLPTLILILPQSWIYPSKKAIQSDLSSSRSQKIIDKLENHKVLISCVFILLSFAAIYLSSKNEVNSDPMLYFGPQTQIQKDYQEAISYMPGIRFFDIVIDSGSDGGVYNPAFLNRVDGFIRKAQDRDQVIQIRSLISSLKKVHQHLNGGDQEQYIIPNTSEGVAQHLLIFSLSLPDGRGIDNQVTADQRYLRLSVMWTVSTTKESVMESEAIIATAQQDFHLNAQPRGQLPIFTTVNETIVDLFLKSLIVVVIFIFLLVLIIFRNLKISLLSMLPNIIPLCMGGGLMWWQGIYLDIGTSIVAAVCLGIAVDDTIHFVSHYMRYYNKDGNVKAALVKTLSTTGGAIVMTTIILVLGFGSFIFGDFVPNENFGKLCALILSFAMITDLVLLPTLLLFKKS